MPMQTSSRNDVLLKRSRAAVWHPCTQMKQHETLPLVPVARAQGMLAVRLRRPALSRCGELVVGESLRARQPAHQRRADSSSLHELEHVMLAGFTHEPVVELSERLSRLTGEQARPLLLRERRRVGHRDRAQDELSLLAQQRQAARRRSS